VILFHLPEVLALGDRGSCHYLRDWVVLLVLERKLGAFDVVADADAEVAVAVAGGSVGIADCVVGAGSASGA